MKSYTREEVYEKTLDYFKGDTLATDVWIDKYCLKDNQKNYYELTPDDMHRRIAKELFRIESTYPNPVSEEEIYNLLKDFKYLIPQGSPMSGIGNNFLITSLSNCFVVDNPYDSYPGIMKTEQQLISIMKRRGGVGLSIHSLRPKSMPTTSVSEKSSGIVLFSDRYSNATREVAQDGRRGALMISCRVDHPDVLDFIQAKTQKDRITGANISVMVTNSFMQAVKANENYEVVFSSSKGEVRKKVNAKKVWDLIIKSAHSSAEPGVLFWDTILRESPADCYGSEGFTTTSTNPCVTGDTLILTRDGELRIDRLINKPVEIWNGHEWSIVTPTITGTNQKILILTIKDRFNKEYILKCTHYHKFILVDGSELEAKDLSVNDHLINWHTEGDYCQKGFYIEKIEQQKHLESLVYCFNEPKNHTGVFNGILTMQCGEIPLSPFDSCRLMAINLYSYVDQPFTKEASFDFGLFSKHVTVFQRLMDDMIDLEIEKINQIIDKITNDDDPEDLKSVELEVWHKIKKQAINGRRTGLGITALGDTLAALNLRYGTKEATSMAVKIQKTLAVESYASSIKMAEERGSFPIWNGEKEMNNPFLGRVLETFRGSEYEFIYSEFGRRNIANLTIAPTGSVSIMTQTTSGIEPCFLPIYRRSKKTNDKSKATYTDAMGDMWEEFIVFHHKFVDWATVYYNTTLTGGEQLSKDKVERLMKQLSQEELDEVLQQSPYYKATANDVDWLEKVNMQGQMQKWVDHSISVTVNVPKETTIETVEKIYMTAWESGCKGCTIYRDGCRDGVLNHIKKEEKGIIYTDAPKRPEGLECDIYYKTALGKDWMVVVGLLEGKPYEIFAFNQLTQAEFPKEIKKGKLIKVKGGYYRLIGDRGDKVYTIENIIDLLNEDEKTSTRRYSLALRHGVNPLYISTQIDKYATISSFDKVMGRVLKTYIPATETGEKCSQCGGVIIMQDGCEKCINCGYAKCG